MFFPPFMHDEKKVKIFSVNSYIWLLGGDGNQAGAVGKNVSPSKTGKKYSFSDKIRCIDTTIVSHLLLQKQNQP